MLTLTVRSLLLITILSLLISGTGCSSGRDDTQSTIMLSWEWLWNPEVEDLPDWQILNQPTHLLRGPYGELIVADNGNSRVLRISTEGDLIEIIGKGGEGPGEFLQPTYLSVERASGDLFVIDPRAGRLSQFSLERDQSQYRESYSSQIPRQLSVPSLVIIDDLSVWTTGYATSPRIRHMNLSGEVLQSFGEPWIIDNIQPIFVDLLNRGLLVDVGNGNLGYLWRTKAQLEIWSREGEHIQETELLFPEVQALMELDRGNDPADLGREWVPFYFHWTDCLPSEEVIFVGVLPIALDAPFVFYELSTTDLSINRKYVCEQIPEIYRIESCIAEKTRNGYRFFALDRYNHGIAVLESLDVN